MAAQRFNDWPVESSRYLPANLQGNRDANNYESWKVGILWLLESQGYSTHIIIPPPPPAQPPVGAGANAPAPPAQPPAGADARVKGWILDALSDEVKRKYVSAANRDRNGGGGSARDLWLELENNMFHQGGLLGGVRKQLPLVVAEQGGWDPHHYLELHKAAVQGNWAAAEDIMAADAGAVQARVTHSLGTVVHVALASDKSKTVTFKEKLVNRIRRLQPELTFVVKLVNHILTLADPESIFKKTNSLGHNALHTAAIMGNISAARALVGACPALLYVASRQGHFPIHLAADEAHRKTLLYLLKKTKDDVNPRNPYADRSGALLLTYVIDAKFYDIAKKLVDKYDGMAKMKAPYRGSALKRIARHETVFSDEDDGVDIFHDDEQNEVLEVIVQHDFRRREQPRSLVRLICEKMSSTLTLEEASDIYVDAMATAAGSGNPVVIEEIVAAFPDAVFSRGGAAKHNFLHVAIQNRRENVFNLIYQAGKNRYHYADVTDAAGNTMLHKVATLAPSHRLNSLPGAALQMQRELQWFKEVEKFVSPYNKTRENHAGKTPRMIFTEEHQDLKEKGEKWMKDTATACTIVAALILTVVFAASITVPGGNRSSDSNGSKDEGHPVFSSSLAFKVFANSVVASLLSSTTSLLMFLSILTRRYAEEDFLYTLPITLCVGLVFLFFSIGSMLVAFFFTVDLVFSVNDAIIISLVFVPILAFVYMEIPLVLAVLKSTCPCFGIFGKKKNGRPFH